MFENGFIFNRTLKHHNFCKFDWTHVLWSLTEQDLSGVLALSFKINGHFVFESTRKAYKCWVKFRKNHFVKISWWDSFSVTKSLYCAFQLNCYTVWPQEGVRERWTKKKKNPSVSGIRNPNNFFFSTHCRKHSAGVYLDTNQWTTWTISGHTLPQHSADSFKSFNRCLSDCQNA